MERMRNQDMGAHFHDGFVDDLCTALRNFKAVDFRFATPEIEKARHSLVSAGEAFALAVAHETVPMQNGFRKIDRNLPEDRFRTIQQDLDDKANAVVASHAELFASARRNGVF